MANNINSINFKYKNMPFLQIDLDKDLRFTFIPVEKFNRINTSDIGKESSDFFESLKNFFLLGKNDKDYGYLIKKYKIKKTIDDHFLFDRLAIDCGKLYVLSKPKTDILAVLSFKFEDFNLAKIEIFYIRKDLRGCGYGSTFLKFLIKNIVEINKDVKAIQLFPADVNAEKFYKKNNFSFEQSSNSVYMSYSVNK